MKNKAIFNKIGIIASILAVVLSAAMIGAGGSVVFLLCSLSLFCGNLAIYISQKKKNNGKPK